MRTQSINYWMNNQQRNEKGKRCSVDKSEYSFEDIAEYLLNREKEKM